jgi:hypothetical protein
LDSAFSASRHFAGLQNWVAMRVDRTWSDLQLLGANWEVVMSDESLRQNIIDEHEFEPSLNAANIRVAVDKKIQIENKHGGQIMIFGWWSGEMLVNGRL